MQSARIQVDIDSVRQPLLNQDHEHDDNEEELDRNHLGTLNGVIVPCLLSILGVVLFLRLGWAVGEAGMLGVFLIFAIAEVQAIITVLSLSALVSNGKMAGGGPYFLISRALGPELGGAIGVLFYAAYVVGATFYTIGFATEIIETFTSRPASGWFLTLIASIVLAGVLLVSIAGAGVFTKVNVLLFVGQFATIVLANVSMLIGNPIQELEHGGTFLGPTMGTLRENIWPQMTASPQCTGARCNISQVFAIVFPAVTGIMEGANLSGDLDKPDRSIGKGTLWAVLISIVTYFSLVVSMAASYPRSTLQTNMLIVQDTCFSGTIVMLGVLVSTGSSALGSIFGGSRVLHALAKDGVFPSLNMLTSGGHTREPRRAVAVTWLLAQLCLFIGDLDAIAPVITSFFCLSYASVNISLVLLRVSGAPNFRPTFRFHTWKLALVGAILNIGIMFWLNIWYGAVALLCLISIFIYLLYSKPDAYWGGVSQALLYHQVRKCLLLLDERKEHAKLWRPSVLLLVDDFESPLLEFCNCLKKGGMYVLGFAIVGPLGARSEICEELRTKLRPLIEERKMKAFGEVACAPTAALAYQSLMQLSGIAALSPNTVVLPIPTQPRTPCSSTYQLEKCWDNAGGPEFASIIRDALILNKNVVVSHHFEMLKERPQRIDVWIETKQSAKDWTPVHSTALLLQLAHILICTKMWRKSLIHVRRIWHDHETKEEEKHALRKFIEESRFQVASVEVVIAPIATDELSDSDDAIDELQNMIYASERLNEVIQRTCQGDCVDYRARVLFLALPDIPARTITSEVSHAYLQVLLALAHNLPPLCFVTSAGQNVYSREF